MKGRATIAVKLSTMRRTLTSTVLFLCLGFLGPVLRLLTWPPSALEARFSERVVGFVNDLVILLWPSILMGDGEGGVKVLVILAGINLLFFVILGSIIGLICNTRRRLLAAYFVLCVLITWLEFWSAGFSRAYLSWGALFVAVILYAIPFVTISRYLDGREAVPS